MYGQYAFRHVPHDPVMAESGKFPVQAGAITHEDPAAAGQAFSKPELTTASESESP